MDKMNNLNTYTIDMVSDEYIKNEIKNINLDRLLNIYKKTKGKNKQINDEIIKRSHYTNTEIYKSKKYVKWLIKKLKNTNKYLYKYFIYSVLYGGMDNIKQIEYIWKNMDMRDVYWIEMRKFVIELADNLNFESLYILSYMNIADIDDIFEHLEYYLDMINNGDILHDDKFAIKLYQEFSNNKSDDE